jgi:DNA-binding LacI/PurR family transcriptional regulator
MTLDEYQTEIDEFDTDAYTSPEVAAAAIGSLAAEIEDACVVMNNERGGALATAYLLDHGHRRIAHVTGPLSVPDARDRLQGYRRALEADPTFNSARYNLALALRDTGDQFGAIAELELVLQADPNGVGTLINLGNLLIESGDIERGQQLIDQANEISGGTP